MITTVIKEMRTEKVPFTIPYVRQFPPHLVKKGNIGKFCALRMITASENVLGKCV